MAAMKRRDFVRAAGYAGLGLGLAPGRRPWPGAPTRWTWVHGGANRDAPDWHRRFARVRAAGVGAVLVSGGDTATLAAAAHAEGLEFHRWIWVLNRSGDREVQERHPDWFTVSRNGDSSLARPPYVNYYQWLCPTRPEVRDYLERVVAAVARDPAVDGVHFDYIRHCDVILPVALWPKYGLVQDREYPEFDFCYCGVCRDAFRQQAGADPLALPDPTADAAWRRFRWDSVTGLVKQIAGPVRAQGKPVTAAVFPTPSIARRLVRQAWDEWGLDAVFPMAYHGFYHEPVSWIGEAVREGVAALPATTPLYAGLYLPDLAPDDFAAAVRAAVDGGAAGVSVFEMDGMTDEHIEKLKSQ